MSLLDFVREKSQQLLNGAESVYRKTAGEYADRWGKFNSQQQQTKLLDNLKEVGNNVKLNLTSMVEEGLSGIKSIPQNYNLQNLETRLGNVASGQTKTNIPFLDSTLKPVSQFAKLSLMNWFWA